jgi:hypothetical protein
VTPLLRRSSLPRRTSSSRPPPPSPSRTRPRLSRASSPTTPARRTPTASSVTSAARPVSPVPARSVPRPRLRRLPTLRNKRFHFDVKVVGVDGFAMTAALLRQGARAKHGHYLLIELLSAGREPKKSLVAPHDTTFYAFCCFLVTCVLVSCCCYMNEKAQAQNRSSPRFTTLVLSNRLCRRSPTHSSTTIMFLLRRTGPQLASRSAVRAMSSSEQRSTVRFQYSVGEDEEQLGRDATALTTEGGGRWKATNDSRGLERTFRFKTFKATWVC